MASLETTDDLRDALFQRLVDSGTVGNVKAALRAQILSKLRSSSSSDHGIAAAPDSIKHTLDSLFVDYLKCHRYMYTLSVFTPGRISSSGSIRSAI